MSACVLPCVIPKNVFFFPSSAHFYGIFSNALLSSGLLDTNKADCPSEENSLHFIQKNSKNILKMDEEINEIRKQRNNDDGRTVKWSNSGYTA